MQNVMFIGWDAPKTGREKQAGELFTSFTNYLGSRQKSGKISSFEPCVLSTHGGTLNGFFFIQGETRNLNEMRDSDEFIKLVMQCGYALNGFGVVGGYSGDSLMKLMGDWNKMVR